MRNRGGFVDSNSKLYAVVYCSRCAASKRCSLFVMGVCVCVCEYVSACVYDGVCVCLRLNMNEL